MGGSDHRAQIVRVLYAIQHHVKPSGRGSLFQGRVALDHAEGKHSLMMRGSASGAVQLLLGFKANRDAARTAQIDQFLNARPGGILGDENALQGPARPKRFPNGMDSCEHGH